MRRPVPPLAAAVLVIAAFAARPVHAHDVDGSGDCFRVTTDFGDAPEGIPAYPSGAIGRFPTCRNATVAVGTVDGSCPPNYNVPAPGSLLFEVSHVNLFGAPQFWLGCYTPPGGSAGIDDEPNGKVDTPAGFASACVDSVAVDCAAAAFGGMTFGQDECFGDGSDAGLTSAPLFTACELATVSFASTHCGAGGAVYLNVLLDMNEDGDWLDAFACVIGGQTVCAHEWAIQNRIVALAPGCESHVTPAFPVGGAGGHAWLRISLSSNPAPLDFPWHGTLYVGAPHFPPVGQFTSGETEDYPAEIVPAPTPARRSTWGGLKLRYR